MTTAESAFPLLVLELPGVWRQASLQHEVDVEHVVEACAAVDADAADSLRLQLLELAAAGGDQLLLRNDAKAPTVLVTAWPPYEDGDPLPEAVEIPRTDGFSTGRLERKGQPFNATYFVLQGHRLLTLTVLTVGEVDIEHERELYDVIASRLTWSEDELVGPVV